MKRKKAHRKRLRFYLAKKAYPDWLEDSEIIILAENLESAYKIIEKHYRKQGYYKFEIIKHRPVLAFHADFKKRVPWVYFFIRTIELLY
jgi:hypothetical protein